MNPQEGVDSRRRVAHRRNARTCARQAVARRLLCRAKQPLWSSAHMSTGAPGPESPIAVVRFPADPRSPITLSFLSLPVELMIVERESVPMGAGKIASEDWAGAGVYVLLGPASGPAAKIKARPGMGSDVLFRLRQHPAETDWFTRAVVARVCGRVGIRPKPDTSRADFTICAGALTV